MLQAKDYKGVETVYSNYHLFLQACKEHGIDCYSNLSEMSLSDIQDKLIAPMQLELIELRRETMNENDKVEYERQIQDLETRITNAIRELEG